MTKRLSIAFVRRGYSPTGGAETYLKRLAPGVIEAGHNVQLIATNEWPEDQWPFGSVTRLHAESVIGFADELEQILPRLDCGVLFSLERIWSCDVYRAGDGVHRAWLARRRNFELPLKQFVRALNRKHRDLLQLEESLLVDRKAGRVIVASRMVKKEIIDLYGYPADRIELIRNGVPVDKFRFDPGLREKAREDLKLKPDQIALVCLLPAAEMKDGTKRHACAFGARSRCSFSAKFQTLCVFTRLRTFSFCQRSTILFPMPVWKRSPADYR